MSDKVVGHILPVAQEEDVVKEQQHQYYNRIKTG